MGTPKSHAERVRLLHEKVRVTCCVCHIFPFCSFPSARKHINFYYFQLLDFFFFVLALVSWLRVTTTVWRGAWKSIACVGNPSPPIRIQIYGRHTAEAENHHGCLRCLFAGRAETGKHKYYTTAHRTRNKEEPKEQRKKKATIHSHTHTHPQN